MTDWRRQAGFGLYLHWPFCAAKCPYCDFNSHVVSAVDQDAWRDAFVSEIKRAAAEVGPRVLNSVYFGGGTPSLMPAETVDAILETVRAAWPMANDVEITLEANPSSVETDRFAGYRQAGVNRVSLGIQALNDDDLRSLGRLHTLAEAMSALEIAKSTFDRVSFDLIYARQNQTPAMWEAELTRALDMSAGHLSLYQLTIEDGTAFARRHAAGGLHGLPSEDWSADMYEITQSLCNDRGLYAYEISNHAAPGAESRHNQIYWQGGDYMGIGPGAHGRITLNGQRYATETPLAPNTWLTRVRATGNGEAPRTVLSATDQANEYLMMGLRTVQGIDLDNLNSLTPFPTDGALDNLRDIGVIAQQGPRLYLTDTGRPILNEVLRHLMV